MREELARLEWDFSTCPKDELQFCLFYEYAREDDLLIRRVQTWRAKAASKTIDELSALIPERKRRWETSIMKHVFGYLPEWPETPYLAIKSRREKLDRLMPDFPDFHIANPLECPIVNRDLLEQIAQEQDRTGKPIWTPTSYSFVVLQIPWEESKDYLVKKFAEWLDANWPGGIENRERRGDATTKAIRGFLSNLGVLRIRKYCGDRSYWERKRRATLKADTSLAERRHSGVGSDGAEQLSEAVELNVIPELYEAIQSGEIDAVAAYEIASRPGEDQMAFLTRSRQGDRKIELKGRQPNEAKNIPIVARKPKPDWHRARVITGWNHDDSYLINACKTTDALMPVIHSRLRKIFEFTRLLPKA
jgi:hypothetical protein